METIFQIKTNLGDVGALIVNGPAVAIHARENAGQVESRTLRTMAAFYHADGEAGLQALALEAGLTVTRTERAKPAPYKVDVPVMVEIENIVKVTVRDARGIVGWLQRTNLGDCIAKPAFDATDTDRLALESLRAALEAGGTKALQAAAHTLLYTLEAARLIAEVSDVEAIYAERVKVETLKIRLELAVLQNGFRDVDPRKGPRHGLIDQPVAIDVDTL